LLDAGFLILDARLKSAIVAKIFSHKNGTATKMLFTFVGVPLS
jgi:hypothetical protein